MTRTSAAMLTEAQVDRYSRQILLPEVGGRGQARLLAARVALAGTGDAAVIAAGLLARAGVGALDLVDGPAALPDAGPDCRVRRVAAAPDADAFVDLRGEPRVALASGLPQVVGRQQGSSAVLVLLVGRPCAACLPAAALAPDGGPVRPVLEDATALALGALAAAETLRALLGLPVAGRRHVLDLGSGTCATTALPPGGCARCGGSA